MSDDRDSSAEWRVLPCVKVLFHGHHSLGFVPGHVHNMQHISQSLFSNRHSETNAISDTTGDDWILERKGTRQGPTIASLVRKYRWVDWSYSLVLVQVQQPIET